VLDDGTSTTGVPTFKEFWYSVVGLSGEAQNFDGNGQYTRVQTGGGANAVKSGRLSGRSALDNQLFGNSIVTPQGTRPTHPDKKPPYKPAVACHRNKRPDLNGPAADAGPADALVGRP
jgi:phospholipid/cholesterol/gamma-HCH transport system substrate-binding protein